MADQNASTVKVDNPMFDELLRKDGEYFARRISDEGVDVAEVTEMSDDTFRVEFPNGDTTEIPDPSAFFHEETTVEKRIQFIAPKTFVDAFDAYANKKGVSRSHLLREAMFVRMLDKEHEYLAPVDDFDLRDFLANNMGLTPGGLKEHLHP